MITIAIQCQHFERRLCWMLSSLYEQTVKNLLVVDVAHMKGSGEPTTDAVLEHFDKLGLNIVARSYVNFDRFQRRGLTRNDQIASCKTDWIWFADCDHVYHPCYVEFLIEHLSNHAGEKRLFTAGRMSTDPDPIAFDVKRPWYHARAFKQCDAIEPKYKRSAPGAGHTQIVRLSNLDSLEYCPETACRDNKWSETMTKARSDIQFRRKVGGKVKLPKWFTYNQIHLNHKRDSDVGRHLVEQR